MTERLKWVRSDATSLITWSAKTKCTLEIELKACGWVVRVTPDQRLTIGRPSPFPMLAQIVNVKTERSAKILARKLAELIKDKKR